MARLREIEQGKDGKQVSGGTKREPSTHLREGKQVIRLDAHSGCHGTHGLEGAWGVALEANGISVGNVSNL